MPAQTRLSIVAIAALTVTAFSLGCGSDSVTEPDTRVSTEGGTVTSANGKASLVIPAGALTEPTAITIEPAPFSADARLLPGTEYIFSPDGLQFAVPARLTVRFDSIPAAMADRAPYIWLHRRTANGWTPMNGQPIDLEGRTLQGEITGFSNYGGATSLLAADLALAALQLSSLLNDVVATNVIALTETIASLLLSQSDPTWQALAAPFMAAMGTTACTAFDNAVNNAGTALVSDWGKLIELLRPVYAWHAVAAKLYGPNGCPNAPLGFLDIQDRKVTEFVDFYIARLDPATFNLNFDKLLDEVRFVLELRGDVQLLGLPASDALLQTRAQWPLLDELRNAAYEACRTQGLHQYLGFLRQQAGVAVFTDDDLLTDLQLCATQLHWSLTSADQTIAFNGKLGGGATPGTGTVTTSTNGIVRGTLLLHGDVRPFRCPDGSYEPDELTVTLNGTEVHARNAINGLFFAQPLHLDAESIFSAAGVDPSQPGTVPLVVSRSSTGCGQYIQLVNAPLPLVTLNIAFPAVESDISGSWALTVDGVCNGDLNIVQTGTTFSADGSVGGFFCPFGNASGSGNGNLNGRSIAFGIAFGTGGGGTATVQFDGVIDGSGNTISGSYSGPMSGGWSATRN